MKFNLRSIIIAIVIILLTVNIFVGIYYIDKHDGHPCAKQDTVLYRINLKRYEIIKDIDNNNKEIIKNNYIYEKIRDSIVNASNNDNFLFFSDYTKKYDSIRYNKNSHNR